MATDDERREVARRLRELRGLDYCKDPRYAVGLASDAIGASHSNGYSWDKMLDRLADLIDPTCEVHRDALFYPATDLMPEHEETVYRCGSCDGMVSYDEDYDPETDAPAYCETCGSRITGIGEPWDE